MSCKKCGSVTTRYTKAVKGFNCSCVSCGKKWKEDRRGNIISDILFGDENIIKKEFVSIRGKIYLKVLLNDDWMMDYYFWVNCYLFIKTPDSNIVFECKENVRLYDYEKKLIIFEIMNYGFKDN